jgi:hypothetical protein
MKGWTTAVVLWSTWLGAAEEGWEYLDDGVVRLGINERAGAAIGWLSESGSERNWLNTFDVGRYVQQSYYGDLDGTDWNGKPWTYNPVQGGSWKNEASVLLESRHEGGEYYAKTRPRHWASGVLLEEVVLEQWIRLERGLARMRFKMSYTGEKGFKPRHQELPALFVDAALETLVVCPEGSLEWTGAALKRMQPGFPNEYVSVSEPWAAWVDAEDRGLGILFPGTTRLTCYRVREGNAKADCSYLAPIRTLALTPGTVVEYEVVIGLGTVEELRKRFGEEVKRGR